MTPLRFKRNISVGWCAALVSWLRCPTYTSVVNSTYRPRAVEYDRECPATAASWPMDGDVDNLLSGDGAKPTREPLTLIRIFDGSAQVRLRDRLELFP